MKLKNKLKAIAFLLWFSLIQQEYILSQSIFYGNTMVSSGYELAIHSDSSFFRLSSFGPTSGITVTERNFPMGYVSFMSSTAYLNPSNSSYVDGYVKTYTASKFVFPVGDNGVYRPVAVSVSSATNPTSAAYFGVNPSVATTSNPFGGVETVLPSTGPFNITQREEAVKNISSSEYWDINGTTPSKITLSWGAGSNVSSLTGGNFKALTIVGWNGVRWVNIPAVVDAVPIIGVSSTIAEGSITTLAEIVPNTYEVYTLAGTIILKALDTNIIVNDTNRIAIGPASTPVSGTDYFVSGPFHGSGTATIDSKTGVISFVPSKVPFLGKDTLYKIRCVLVGSVSVCDTFKIIISGMPTSRPLVSDFTDFNTPKILADLPSINTGGMPYSTTTNSTAGSKVTIDANGKVNYQPRNGFSGYDTVSVIRCVDGNCDTVVYVVYVKPKESLDIPNYISPNGDGVNDVWVLPSSLISKYPNLKVIVYNRWGNIVWRSTGTYKNDWYGQGQSGSGLVIDGVYYYLIELDSEFNTTMTGFIEVMRQ